MHKAKTSVPITDHSFGSKSESDNEKEENNPFDDGPYVPPPRRYPSPYRRGNSLMYE